MAEKVTAMQPTDDVTFTSVTITQLRSIYNKAADPTVTDDTNAGYEVGDRWLNNTTDTWWVCFANTAGAADWEEAPQ